MKKQKGYGQKRGGRAISDVKNPCTTHKKLPGFKYGTSQTGPATPYGTGKTHRKKTV